MKSTSVHCSANSETSILETANNEFKTSFPDKLSDTDIAVTCAREVKMNAEIESTVRNQLGCGITSAHVQRSRKAQNQQSFGK